MQLRIFGIWETLKFIYCVVCYANMLYYPDVCLCSQWKLQCSALLDIRVNGLPPLWIMLELIWCGGRLAIFLRSYLFFYHFRRIFTKLYITYISYSDLTGVTTDVLLNMSAIQQMCEIDNTVATEEMYISEKLFNTTSVIAISCKWFINLLRGCMLWRFGSRRPFQSFWPRSVHICRDLSECMSKPGCAGRQPVGDVFSGHCGMPRGT